MPRYVLTALSSQDFEELVRDLLQAEWNVRLEAFKTGRDSGIDLRYAPADGGATIVQCKHYAGSGFTKLLAHLRDTERPKVERLQPSRYVVVTSVGLTPANKDEIVQALRPFVRCSADVLGAQDIEGLLSRHPRIERANFKLWLTSTSVLERVVHNAELCQREFEVEWIRRKLPLFVQNEAFPRAMEFLDQSRIVVVSGIPGIGKTTLAEMLLYAHLEQGYEPVVIQAEIAEGKRLFKTDAKQIFYFDDFLGQTFLGDRKEYLRRNEDVAIVSFMEMIRQSAHGRFILTTREHILRSALHLSERLAHSPILDHRCILELRDYSHGQKARILYNHLYFSDLSHSYKDAILQDNFFFQIIKHEHFNPRLIEWLSSQARLRGVTSEAYQTHILDLLESPDSIWAHAFHNQISRACRHVLLSFYTLGWAETCDLEPAFIALHRHNAAKYQHETSPGDFRKALQELDGAFLSYMSGHVGFLNPSIREFVGSVISGDREVVEDLVTSAIRFKQLRNLWQLAEARPNSELSNFLTKNLDFFSQSLSRLSHGPALRWEKSRYGGMRGYQIDMGEEARIGFLIELSGGQKSKPITELALKASENLIAAWNHKIPDFRAVIGLLGEMQKNSWFLTHGGRDMYRAVLDGILDRIGFASADDWLQVLPFQSGALEWTETDELRLSTALNNYTHKGVDDERRDYTTLDELSNLKDALEELTNKFGLDFSRTIERLNDSIAEREEHDDDRERYHEGSGYSGSGTGIFQRAISDDDIAQMFSTLHESS